jgi:hypothetical protein
MNLMPEFLCSVQGVESMIGDVAIRENGGEHVKGCLEQAGAGEGLPSACCLCQLLAQGRRWAEWWCREMLGRLRPCAGGCSWQVPVTQSQSEAVCAYVCVAPECLRSLGDDACIA